MAAEVEDLGKGVLNPVVGLRMDKLPIKCLLAAGLAMKVGMKYEKNVPDNWRHVPAEEHWNHAQTHMLKYRAGDRSEPHVGHAVSRVLMWAELEIEKAEAANIQPGANPGTMLGGEDLPYPHGTGERVPDPHGTGDH